jgi:uncharacterized protein YjiS (DUF1127 family)
MCQTEIDFQAVDYSRLTPAQWNLVKREAMRRGKACRDEALRSAAAWLGAWGRRMAVSLVAWRRNRAAAKALGRLDDRALKDIGIDRTEIASVVALGKNDRTRRPARPERRAA